MERKSATSTNTLALRIGQPMAVADSALRLSGHMSPNLREETEVKRKKEEHKMPLHPIESKVSEC